ncbi:hypothetical protein [uncultured Roseovarius sp.]|uniref:phosphoribosyltransferase-like protein n=1 Tax=uncultured Roseovarius sp. TaxID=293344 RepID=UPI00261CDF71|nr:hypothetical protein [uncultured Roseovarius sp.]
MKAEHVEWLDDLVTANSWEAFDHEAHPTKSVRDAIYDLLAHLPRNEASLVLQLLEDYRIVKDYTSFARALMVEIKKSVGNAETIITPVRDYNAERPKSGQALHYDMGNFTAFFEDNQVKLLDDLRSDKCQSHNGPHISVDDFIGTGGQFLKMRDKVVDSGKDFNVTHIATMCIQEEAAKRLAAEGFQIITLDTRPKALPQLAYKSGRLLNELYAEYDILESKTACPERAKRGWDGSEALITLKSTPNNTLPIFWVEGKKKWPAPFPRPKR